MSMKTPFLIAPLLALCMAGTAWAQTVSPEHWVGAPISTVGGQMSRAAVVAERERAARQPEAMPEQWVGSLADAGIQVGAVRRSEVQADTALYARAGLLNDLAYQQYELPKAAVGLRVATYQRLRSGPQFAQEVERFEIRPSRMARMRAFFGSGV